MRTPALPPSAPTRGGISRQSSFAVLAIALHLAVTVVGAWLWRQRADATPVLFGQTVAIAFMLRAPGAAGRLVLVGTTIGAGIAAFLIFDASVWLTVGSVLAHVANLGTMLAVVAAGKRWRRRSVSGRTIRGFGLAGTLFWTATLAPVVAALVAAPFATWGGLPEAQHAVWTRWASNVIGAVSVLPLALSVSFERLRQLHRQGTAWGFYLTVLSSLLTTRLACAYFPFPFVVIALPLLYAASRYLVLGASIAGLANVVLLICLSMQPLQDYPALHSHALYVPFAIVFTLIAPLVVALLSQQRDETLSKLARAHELMEVEAERRRVTLDSIGDAVVSIDADLRVEYLNPVAEKLTGFTKREASGQPIEEILQLFEDVGTGAEGPKASNPLIRCMTTRATVTLDEPLILRHRSGGLAYVGDSSAPVFSSDGETVEGAVAVFQDVTQRHAAARAIQRRAMHDALTDLFNRQEFELRVRALLEGPGDTTTEHVACFMDLDRFKAVNDNHGHAAGDEVLRVVAATLNGKTRASDVVARLGGDEFAWILPRCPLEFGLRMARELVITIESLGIPWEGTTLSVGASVGLVAFRASECDYETLLRHADSACYAAKKSGRGRVAVYPDDVEAPSQVFPT